MKQISWDSDWLSSEEKEQSSKLQEGRVAAITWMKLSRKSSGQVEAYLRQRKFSEEVIRLVLESLREDGRIDDHLLASRLVKQRQGRQTESRAALANRLRRLGLADEAVDAALPADGQDDERARALLLLKFGSDLKDVRKAARFLAGRGFSAEVIRKALRAGGVDLDFEDS
jgi:regulatory protein